MAYPDPIQDSDVVCVGWFLGAVTETFNVKDFVPALNLHPLLQNTELEIQIQEFRSLPRERWHTVVKVPHLFCAGWNLTKVKRADPYRQPSPVLLAKTRKAAVLQKQYENKLDYCYSTTITMLDYHISDPAISTTLRELTMCIKAADGRNLLTSIDTMWNGEVAFSFLTTMKTEAEYVVHFLHLIVEANLRSRAASWFYSSAFESTDGMFWDTNTGLFALVMKLNLATLFIHLLRPKILRKNMRRRLTWQLMRMSPKWNLILQSK